MVKYRKNKNNNITIIYINNPFSNKNRFHTIDIITY